MLWAYPGAANQQYFDPEGNWLGEAGGFNLNVVRWGDRFLVVYEGSETYFNHVNNLGSTAGWTDQTGAPQEDILFYPWGDVWQLWGIAGYNFAELPYRDLTTTTDLTMARVSSPNFGRWFSPNPAGLSAVHLEDPQSWNMYAYVRNNPATLTDPKGLDFNLACATESDTCHNNQVGTWSTDKNGNQNFTATVVTSASLQDPNSGSTAVVNASGVEITTAQGTFEGVFINGTPSAAIQGDPRAAGWSDFTFNILGSDVQHGNVDYGTATYKWSSSQSDVMSALGKMSGEFTYPGEGTLYNNHPGNFNFRFSTGIEPSLIDYGPSPHFTVPQDPTPTVPVGPGYVMGFHVDSMTGAIPHVLCAKLGWCQ